MHHWQLKYSGYISKENLLFSHLCCRQEWADAHCQTHLQRSLPHLHTADLFSAVCGTWLGSVFWVFSTAEAHLPGMIACRRTDINSARFVCQSGCSSQHLLHFGLCSSLVPSLPSLRAETPSGWPRSGVWPKGIWHHGSLRVGFLSCYSSFGQGWNRSVGGWMEFIALILMVAES